MFIDDITSSGAMPALEMTMRFAGARNRLLAHNIANADTPDFRPMDVSTAGFQRQLRDAVEARRERTVGGHGALRVDSTREVAVSATGRLELRPWTPGPGVLGHDRNNTDMERTVQALVENVGVFRTATDLLRSKYEMLRLAMMER